MQEAPSRRVRHRAHAYITHSQRLLIFRHVDFPNAGIQVPAGTIDVGEPPEEAVMREAWEETGLENLTKAAFLGNDVIDQTLHPADPAKPSIDERLHRWFYHLRCEEENPPEKWRHAETSNNQHDPIWFELWWVDWPDGVPKLRGGCGDFLPKLAEFL